MRQSTCLRCGMGMVIAAGFGREPEAQTCECLRCGFVQNAVATLNANHINRDAKAAKRVGANLETPESRNDASQGALASA
jgi:hypothetical protein